MLSNYEQSDHRFDYVDTAQAIELNTDHPPKPPSHIHSLPHIQALMQPFSDEPQNYS